MKRLFLFVILALGYTGVAAQEMSISTNVADYLVYGTLNVEAGYGLARHWSVNAGAKYNPFTYGEGEDAVQMRQRLFSAGARWWPWHIYSGWWVGAKFQYQEFNDGGIRSSETSEGDRFGGGLAAGYSRMIGKHFNLDFGLGFWAGYSRYTTFLCQNCGRRISEGTKTFILPNDIILGINYIF